MTMTRVTVICTDKQEVIEISDKKIVTESMVKDSEDSMTMVVIPIELYRKLMSK